jgi:hypothetical protein
MLLARGETGVKPLLLLLLLLLYTHARTLTCYTNKMKREKEFPPVSVRNGDILMIIKIIIILVLIK